MRKTIRKIHTLAWMLEKEEKWLNEMAEKGLCLISVGFFRYEFEECEPGEYRICVQMLERTSEHPESKNYIELIEDTGAEQVCAYNCLVYFRKKASDGSFELFSDNASRIKYISSIIKFISFSPFLLLVGVMSLQLFLQNPDDIFDILHLVIALFEIPLGLSGSITLYKLKKMRKKLSQEG